MMQIDSAKRFVLGVFHNEIKNRFLCEVEIDGQCFECYVPSSCRLSNFLNMKGKNVILINNQSTASRTKYSLFALPYKSSFILLNPSMANTIVDSCIHSRRFAFLGKRKRVIREHVIEGYKADLYIQDTETIVEIKAVISTESYALFPTVFSGRALEQLKKLQLWLNQGKKACFIILSLNPFSKGITINNSTEFSAMLDNCVKMGLTIKAYTCRFNMEKDIRITREIPILF